MEQLLSRHRKEQRDLQSQITQKKKSASKKSRKAVNDECTELERNLKTRHEQERAAIENGSEFASVSREALVAGDATLEDDILASLAKPGVNEEEQLSRKIEAVSLNSSALAEIPQQQQQQQQQVAHKPNRQKARLARRAAEQEAAAAQAAEEAANLPDLKTQERDRMLECFKKHGLVEKEVAANGHCLYLAVADQMRQLGQALNPGTVTDSQEQGEVKADDYKTVRNTAAKYISENEQDFVPFLEEPMDEYLRKIKDTGEWGGQLELMALAKSYSININVLQGDGRVEKISGSDEVTESPEAWLAYYKHGFGLGEHYNSLRKFAEKRG